MNELPDEKKELRARLRAIRDTLDPSVQKEAGRRAAAWLFESELVREKRSIMLYASIRSEVDTQALLAYARSARMRVAFPRVTPVESSLEAAWVDDDSQLKPGTMGIREPAPELSPLDPASLDLIVVPGLGFDRQGFRLGYGAGHYDRFLLMATRATWIGLTYDACLVPSIPTEPHDQRMHWVLTESGLFQGESA